MKKQKRRRTKNSADSSPQTDGSEGKCRVETRFYWNGESPRSFTISQDNTYTFGFTGWNTMPKEPIYDDFDMFVWETRRKEGIEEPMPEPIGWKDPEVAGQLLWGGSLTVKTPSYPAQVYNIGGDSGGTGSDNEGD